MTSQHNVATFAGAVAGSVGFLGLVAIGIFISIYRRRRNAAKRERISSMSSRETDAEAATRSRDEVPGTVPRISRGGRTRGGMQAQQFGEADHGLCEEVGEQQERVSPSLPGQMRAVRVQSISIPSRDNPPPYETVDDVQPLAQTHVDLTIYGPVPREERSTLSPSSLQTSSPHSHPQKIHIRVPSTSSIPRSPPGLASD
ncbi:hypothetical protein VNI00_006956 [Paramarasmius palmivorus]|uniref:Uncharacterized protein n=1 Tax=Paramarasmius palmivorus TaxID=297713 RepID=A0AAW0D335_9AGAR